MTKRFRFRLLLTWLFLMLSVNAHAFTLEKILEFGSDEDQDYIFFKRGPIAVDDDGNIFIVDSERCVIRKYTGKGRFVKETGARGQGPQAFLGISGIVAWNDSLLIYDYINKRLSRYGLDLEHLKSEKLDYASSSGMSCNQDHLFFNYWEGFRGGLTMVKPFSEKSKVLFPEHDFGRLKKYRKSPLCLAYFTYCFSVDPDSGELVAALRFPLTGEPELFSYDGSGELRRRVRMERIAKYYFDERRLDVRRCREVTRRGSALVFIRAFHVADHQVVFVYEYSADIGDPDTVEAGLLLVDTKDGKILGRLHSKELDIRCVHHGLAYGYIRDAEDAELKVAIYKLVLE